MTDHARDRDIRDLVEQDSDDLLAAVDDIRRLELEKRKVPMSSDEFHARAREIEHRSRAVFGLARREDDDARELSGEQEETIDDEAENDAESDGG